MLAAPLDLFIALSFAVTWSLQLAVIALGVPAVYLLLAGYAYSALDARKP